jgi:hypothetical protein
MRTFRQMGTYFQNRGHGWEPNPEQLYRTSELRDILIRTLLRTSNKTSFLDQPGKGSGHPCGEEQSNGHRTFAGPFVGTG